ncbi:MAG: DUF4340 domain-containing protein [Gemmataceae bacterium]
MPSELWQVPPGDEVVRFSVAKAGQAPYQLSRQGDAWQVTGPFTVAAPAGVVDRLTTALQSPRAEEYRAYPAGDLAAYGLAKPAVTLTLETKAGQKHTISLGAAATGGKPGRFATTGQGVLVVSDAGEGGRPERMDFLDRDLLKFDDAAATAATRRRGGETLELEKDGDAWKLTKPTPQPADERRGRTWCAALVAARRARRRLPAEGPQALRPGHAGGDGDGEGRRDGQGAARRPRGGHAGEPSSG